jgi:hypothetical protein
MSTKPTLPNLTFKNLPNFDFYDADRKMPNFDLMSTDGGGKTKETRHFQGRILRISISNESDGDKGGGVTDELLCLIQGSKFNHNFQTFT